LPDPKPLDVTERYGEAASVSFTDGLNGQTTYFYHVRLKGLRPGTRYYYQVSDGAHTPGTSFALVPDYSSGRPNLQTIWLEQTLAQARRDPSVDMIVVFMHQCDVDVGARQRLRSRHPPGLVAAVRQVRGRPGAVRPRARLRADLPGPRLRRRIAWHRRGAQPRPDQGGGRRHAADDKPQAKIITTRNAVVGSQATGFSKDGADSIEDAPWSAAINPTDAYGYSIFDVDPGEGRDDGLPQAGRQVRSAEKRRGGQVRSAG
jgi:Purple acid Phosphatase, N-terminal domain